MAAWRKEEVDAARHRQEKRGNETGKACYCTRKCRTCKATSTGIVDEPKESSTGTRRAETCVASINRLAVDASRKALLVTFFFSLLYAPVFFLFLFSLYEQRGGTLPNFLVGFSFLCSAAHKRD